MLNSKYMMYKQTYKDFVILIQSGSFYVTFGDDALVLNNLFHYKIKSLGNNVKAGFPINVLNKITTLLNKCDINYIVISSTDDIVDKRNEKVNKYRDYINNGYELSINRINKINEVLKNNLSKKNINEILTKIEDIICTINF